VGACQRVLLLRLPRLLKQTEGWEVRQQQVTKARSSSPPSCQPGKRVQRTEGPEWEPGWATSWQQGGQHRGGWGPLTMLMRGSRPFNISTTHQVTGGGRSPPS
jgi:hypothetical protein